ncbi:MAG: glutaredoxin family protein [Betaproteobacteria bacterium]|nr:glutaredoxin family protein [Betaproteobacteria bacterium]
MADRPHLVVYGRAYCHLCDDMVAALTALQEERGFSLEVVDVDADPELEARYDVLVPVLTLEGREICHYHLDREKLDAALR